MADKKISALTAATTPLAGTEVLPIVQGGSTVKVSIANVTAGRDIGTKAITTTGNVGVKCTPLSITPLQVSLGTDRRLSTFLNGSDNVFGFLTDAGNWTSTFYTGTPAIFGNGATEAFRIGTDQNITFKTAGKGIVDSTGTTSLQFTSLQVVSNKQIVAPSVVTATGNTASTPTATPVTLFTPSGDGVWIVNALVTLTGAPAAYIASSMIKASGGVLAATAISTATNMSISVSGANVQATQTSGGNQVIAFSYIRLF